MHDPRKLVWCGGLLLLLLCGCQRAAPPDAAPAGVQVDDLEYQIRGPLTHENLAVFLLCSERQDDRDFLTLEEGLKEGVVTITEQEQERVGALQIENQSDRPLYLQEGERLQGGKQDRTILSSLIVPPRSGKTAVPTFCVEQSRWTEGDKGRSFGFTVNPALAPKGVRGAAKIEDSQTGVWTCVAGVKASGQARLRAPNTNSSVNELLDSTEVRKLSDDYSRVLVEGIDWDTARDAVGVAIVLNGQIEEVNVYPNRVLFGKLLPRLILSYALQAALLKDQPKAAQAVTPTTVAAFLRAEGEISKLEKKLDTRNNVQIRELDDNRFQCATRYDGQIVHWQVLKRNGKGEATRVAILGSDW